MNENPDFETRLQGLRPKALPEAWRAEILERARSAASARPRRARLLPPRWLMAGWSLAWAATLVLHLASPDETPAPRAAPSTAALAPALNERTTALQSLLASNLDTFTPVPP